MELLDEPRLTEAGFADDLHELPFAGSARAPNVAAAGAIPLHVRQGALYARTPTRRPPPLARTIRIERRPAPERL